MSIPKKMDKKCLDHCPRCDAPHQDISWQMARMIKADTFHMVAECMKCHCSFKEIFKYSHTEQ